MLFATSNVFHLPWSITNRVDPGSRISPSLATWKALHENAIMRSRTNVLQCISRSFSATVFSSVSAFCADLGENKVSLDLEAEIFEFMHNSMNPRKFPSKADLIAKGRLDLVEAITSSGGWLALGWDSEQKDGNNENPFDTGLDNHELMVRKEVAASPRRAVGLDITNGDAKLGPHCSVKDVDGFSSAKGSKKEDKCDKSSLRLETSKKDKWDRVFMDIGNKFSSRATTLTSSSENISKNGATPNSLRPRCSKESDPWRMWISQRAGCQTSNFEAAENILAESRKKTTSHCCSRATPLDDMVEQFRKMVNDAENYNSGDVLDHKDHLQEKILSRLQQLEQELSSLQNLLKSKEIIFPDEGYKCDLKGLQRLTDTCNIQLVENVKAQNNLHSGHAKKLAPEEKVSMKIKESGMLVKHKQRRNVGKKAPDRLQTISIIWPNSASEVLLTGSFDGWTSQREMVKSSSGFFSLKLRLYPGRYEIKFIVDGIWMIDPLRPVVNDKGYENNLLLVS